ncbi:hypothetical protein ACFL7D_09670 [candidate division KSB1 bacterium]
MKKLISILIIISAVLHISNLYAQDTDICAYLMSAESNIKQSDSKPPLRTGKLTGQALWGNLLGLSGGVILQNVFDKELEFEDKNIVELLPFYTGALLTSSITVFKTGIADDTNGEFKKTLIGSLIGILPFVILSETNEGFIYNASLGSTIGAIIGFNMSRSYKPGYPKGALPTYNKGKTNISAFSFNMRLNPNDGRSLMPNVDLLRIRF